MAVLSIIGTGPGAVSLLTGDARHAIDEATVIVGYGNYINLIQPLVEGKRVVSTGMMQEVERCRMAISLARSGESVALVSGGDPGIYGMAGLVLELLDRDDGEGPEVRVFPGISAIQAAAALLGAPVMHDFAVISLSDLLTPWQVITARLAAAATADFVVALYNPRSKRRAAHIGEARRILLAARGGDTPVGIVRNACREGEQATVTTLEQLLDHEIDMSTVVIVGNSSTFVDRQGRMVTPRGYAGKYDVGEPLPPGQPAGSDPCTGPGALMLCGTASDVGKSVLTAGICRLLLRRGLTVAPYKSQNMSLNSFVTPEGAEIGRAQAVQAQACRIHPHTDMNPILLKPNSETGCQVVIHGRPVGNMSITEYDDYKPTALELARQSLDRLKQAYEFIVIEGAGSISEINLKHNDIANLRIALLARCPVILVADIDRGGVFAQIIGTIDLLEPQERACIRGIIINKFRGDAAILESGLAFIRERTGIPVLGVVPWLPDLNLPAEDSMALSQRSKLVSIMSAHRRIMVGVLKLPRISNFTDFDALQNEPDVCLTYIEAPQQLSGLDLLILPGSKSTIADLYFLMERGFYDPIRAFSGRIVGICGGYQMLGTRILDPHGVESSVREAEGLGLLPVQTEMLLAKETHQVQARLDEAGLILAPDCSTVMTGYEIHMGISTPTGPARPFARIFRRGCDQVDVADGEVSGDGRIFGTYLHGIFDNQNFRDIYLNAIRLEKGMQLRRGSIRQPQDDPFERLADHLERHLDMQALSGICGLER